MITANVFSRTFRIAAGGQAGTGFTLDVDDRQYLVTASHVLSDFDGKNLCIFNNGNWLPAPCTLVGNDPNADISVLALNTQLSPSLPLDASGSVTLGQFAYFLGFPLGLQTPLPLEMNRGFPAPLVKLGIVSSVQPETQNVPALFLLDGHGNKGFSGGPVVYVPFDRSPDQKDRFCVAAVVSNYPVVKEPVYKAANDPADPLFVASNPGIVVAHDIKYAIKLINDNPIGFAMN